MLKDYSQLASKGDIQKAIEALKANGIEAETVETGAEAKSRVLALIPAGAEVMTMTSVTLSTLGIDKELNDSGKYSPARAKFPQLDARAKKQLGAAPEWAIGSVHAATVDGKLMIASNTGSQLPAYANGADHVIWVVGGQKLVSDVDDGTKRIYEYVLPLESVRANKAYNITTGSFVSKLLIINREVAKGRLRVIFVNEVLGF
ncbi:MAG: LUD domain-containing protein [Candidatus Doudnabacteria bacterium]|nr:LUD domain-containing protein [Candidatus Doudnabacteria bacterium]